MNEEMEVQDDAIRTGVRAGDDSGTLGSGVGATNDTGTFGGGAGRSGYLGSGVG